MFTWIVTGAAGHLGGTIVRLLQERKAEVRGLVLPHESAADQGETRYFTGDVTLPETRPGWMRWWCIPPEFWGPMTTRAITWCR